MNASTQNKAKTMKNPIRFIAERLTAAILRRLFPELFASAKAGRTDIGLLHEKDGIGTLILVGKMEHESPESPPARPASTGQHR
ncbi:MAG: hypothetical protein LBU76_08440 [Azoarcus sp.]|jgi:hypothetical protein|nr:hypothetical protein [Azoarcus sp.]